MGKEDGAEYTLRSISQFVAGLQRYFNERKPAPVRLADASNPTFRPLHTALYKRYRELHAQGVGTKRKQAEVVSNHEEQQLCSGTSTLLVQNCYYPELLKYHVYCLCTFCYPQLLYIMWSVSMYNT